MLLLSRFSLPELFVNFEDESFVHYTVCKYFLPFCGLSFNFCMVSFAVQELLNLTRSHLFIFGFVSITLGYSLKKCCCDLCQRVFCLCFPLRVLQFLILHLGL